MSARGLARWDRLDRFLENAISIAMLIAVIVLFALTFVVALA
jgi:hypothetical protein